jgi:hypothetical protein
MLVPHNNVGDPSGSTSDWAVQESLPACRHEGGLLCLVVVHDDILSAGTRCIGLAVSLFCFLSQLKGHHLQKTWLPVSNLTTEQGL